MMDTEQFAKMITDLHDIKKSTKWLFWKGWLVATITYWLIELIWRQFD